MAQEEQYLSDGVYASFDGYQIWLRTPRADGDYSIALGPPVLDALRRYVTELRLQRGGAYPILVALAKVTKTAGRARQSKRHFRKFQAALENYKAVVLAASPEEQAAAVADCERRAA